MSPQPLADNSPVPPPNPQVLNQMTDLEILVKAAVARYDELTPEQKRTHRAAQAKSWVIGEMLLEHPEMTRDHAEKIWENLSR